MKMQGLLAVLLVLGLFSGLVCAGAAATDFVEKITATSKDAADKGKSNDTGAGMGIGLTIRASARDAALEYAQFKTRHANAREEWVKAKLEYAAAQQSYSGPALVKARNYTGEIVGLMSSQVKVLSSRIGECDCIDEPKKEMILAKLDEREEHLERVRAVVRAAQNKSDVSAAAMQIRENWSGTKPIVKKYTGVMLASKLTPSVDRFELFLQTANERADALEAKGYDVTSLRGAISSAELKLAEARAKHEQAMQVFEGIEEAEDADELFSEGHALLREAKQMFTEAVHEVRDAFRRLLQNSA